MRERYCKSCGTTTTYTLLVDRDAWTCSCGTVTNGEEMHLAARSERES